MEVSPNIIFPDPEEEAILALFVGRRKSGKSALFVDMLTTVWKKKWDLIIILSKTFKHQSLFKCLAGQLVHFEHWSPDIFDLLIESQRNYKERRVMLFIDDMSEEGRTQCHGINEFAFIGRHFRISVIWLVQRLGLATPGYRQECDLIVLFREENPRELRLIHMEWGIVEYREFHAILTHYTETPYTFLVFQNIKGIVQVFSLPDNPGFLTPVLCDDGTLYTTKKQKADQNEGGGAKKRKLTKEEIHGRLMIDYGGIPNVMYQKRG